MRSRSRSVFFNALVLAALVSASTLARARDFYVDPATGSPTGDGSAASPWRTLQEVVEADLIETQHWSVLPYAPGATLMTVNGGAPIRAGDTIWLRSGDHGDFVLQGAYNTTPITVAAEAGHTPQLHRVRLRAASSWVLRGLSISPSYGATYSTPTPIVDIDNHGHHGPSSDIVIEGCDVFSLADASGWTASQWMSEAANGIVVDGDRVILANNRIRNTRFAVTVNGENVNVTGNFIENFSADGIRGLGDFDTYEYNRIQNAMVADPPDGNHDDGLQSWSTDAAGTVGAGEVRGVVLRGNTIISHIDPSHPLRGSMQGVGCFDGFFVDWVIENNLVVVNHFHGITLLGARNVRVLNNTVVDLEEGAPGPAWIMIGAHKDGRASDGLVRNNLVTRLNNSARVSEDHNIELSDPSLFFVEASALDFHLLPASSAVDTGALAMAPTLDIERIARPQGAGVDVGAYEWHEPAVMPADAGVAADAGAAMGADAGEVTADAGEVAIDAGGTADAGGMPADAGVAGRDAGPDGGVTGGCTCNVRPAGGVSGGALLVLLGVLFWTRRSR